MTIQNSDFTAWTPLLPNLHLSDLDVHEDQGLVINMKGTTALEPGKIARIKEQFNQCVASCMAPWQEWHDLPLQIQSLRQKEKKIAFLENLMHSPLLKEIYGSPDDISRLAQQIQRENASYQQTLQLSANRLKQYIEQAPVKDEADFADLKRLQQDFANLSRASQVQGEVSKTVEKREQALVKKWLASLALLSPALVKVLKQLTQEDRQFLYHRIGHRHIDINQAASYITTLPVMCRLLSEIKDPELRQMLKQSRLLTEKDAIIFLTMATSGAEPEVKSLLDFVEEDPEVHFTIHQLLNFPAGLSPADHCGQLLQFVQNVKHYPDDLQYLCLQKCRTEPVTFPAFINRIGTNALQLELGLKLFVELRNLLPDKFALIKEWMARPLTPPISAEEFFASKGENGLLTGDSQYWEKCQQQLEKHPVARDWVKWMSHLLPIDKEQARNWRVRASEATLHQKSMLADLFLIERSHPDLFAKMVSILQPKGSWSSLENLINFYHASSYEQAKNILESIEAYPRLLDLSVIPYRFWHKPEILKAIGQLQEKGIPISNESVIGIPWHDIPEKIWEKDPSLPIRLAHWRQSSFPLYALLDGACERGEKALVYQLLKTDLSKDEPLMKTLTKLAAEHGDAIALACYHLLYPDPEDLFGPDLPFLATKPWTPAFDAMLTSIETQHPAKGNSLMQRLFSIVYAFDPEARMQKLPQTWRFTLIQVLHMGLSYPERVQPLCRFIEIYPDIVVVQELLKFLERLPAGSSYDWISFAMDHPECLKNADIYRLDSIAGKIPSEHLAAFFRLPQEKRTNAFGLMLRSPDLFIEMMKWDAQFRPPPGRAISSDFNEQIAKKLTTEPSFAEAVKGVGLNNVDSNLLQKWGNCYLDFLRLQPHNPYLRNVKDPQFWSAVNRIDLNRISHPARFVDHIATVASLGGISDLKAILSWMETHDYQTGVRLLDMAKAGYLPEVRAMVTAHPELISANSPLQGLAIQSAQTVVPPSTPQVSSTASTAASSTQEQTIKQFEYLVGRISEFESLTIDDRERALEAALATEMAQSLVSPAGHIQREVIPAIREGLRNLSVMPPDSDHALYLHTTLDMLERDPTLSEMLSKIEISHGPASQMVRRMLRVPEDEPLTNRHAQVAALSALLSRLRQSSGVGSCFATSWGIITQSDSARMKATLEDYRSMLKNNALERKGPTIADGTFTYPIAIQANMMAQNPLRDNLLLKSREAVLASMGANARWPGKASMMGANLMLFEEKGPYHLLMPSPPPPIEATHLLGLLRKTCLQLAKATINYDRAHPDESTKGMWELERRDRMEKIADATAYRALHQDILKQTFEQLHQQFPAQKDLLDKLHATFSEWVANSQHKSSLWMDRSGGFEDAVIAADLQFPDHQVPTAHFEAVTPADQFRALLAFCDALPENEKQRFLSEPDRLWPIGSSSHAFCLKPSLFLQQLAEGKKVDAMFAELNSGTIRMANLSQETQKTLFEEMLKKIPATMRTPMRNQIAKLDTSKMTIEEFGQKILSHLDILSIGSLLDPKIRGRIENVLFSVLSKDMQQGMPVFLVGDLNYREKQFNNSYLALARSPLDGALMWVICQKNGGSRYPLHFKLKDMHCMQPISRIENGRLTYK